MVHYVIFRDDDVHALTPVSCIEKLYRPFLDKKLPVSLSLIPNVNMAATQPNGAIEEFLLYRKDTDPAFAKIGLNRELTDYLLSNPLYHIAQHGYHHDHYEFGNTDRHEVARRLDEGLQLITEAGFPKPCAFVAPHDVISRNAMIEIAERFPVIAKHWFESGQLPMSWWPAYVFKKIRGNLHWKVGNTILLGRTRSYLSYDYPLEKVMNSVKASVASQTLSVVSTHWWTFFKDPSTSDQLIELLHQTANYLAENPDIRVITYQDLLEKRIPLF